MVSRFFDSPDKSTGDTRPIAKVGRPTNYKPEYCQRALDLDNQGYSLAMIIAEIGAGSRQTIDNWKKAHPEFFDAITRARELALAYGNAWVWPIPATAISIATYTALLWRPGSP